MSTEAAADDEGVWYVPPRSEQAHRKKVERWLRTRPHVKVSAEAILEFVYDVSDSLEEAQYWVKETLWLLDYYLLAFPDKEIADRGEDYSWCGAIWDGGYVSGHFGSSDPKGVIFPPRAEIEAWVAKNGGIVPLPKHPPAIR